MARWIGASGGGWLRPGGVAPFAFPMAASAMTFHWRTMSPGSDAATGPVEISTPPITKATEIATARHRDMPVVELDFVTISPIPFRKKAAVRATVEWTPPTRYDARVCLNVQELLYFRRWYSQTDGRFVIN